MTKIRVKQKQLAKLREFRKGMDIEEYLLTEYRQLLRALQNQYVEVDDSVEAGDIVVNRGASILWGSNQAALSNGVIPIVNGGNVTFDATLGSISANIFFPAVQGMYFIKFGFRHSSAFTVSGGNPNTTTITALDSTNASIGTADGYDYPPFSDATKLGVSYPKNGLFYELGPSLGLYFNVSRSGAGSPTLTKFYCELTKVSE